jgi:ABC-type polysaccharide/polyol phosphate transport system ATPase subunit
VNAVNSVDTAIAVENATKRFTLRHAHSIKEMTVRAVRRQSLSTPFTALDDVSLSVRQGESVALMGLNGSGKSTLLKLVSGVMRPDGGSVRVRGRVAGLIEVGAGLHPDLTGRENIFLNAAILGMSKAETQAKYDAIVAFSEIESFLDTQVKFYSSGMFMRLGFSVAVHTEPDVFLVDEVLAVGDPPFQKKCLKRIEELRDEGRTLVIVSHDMGTLEKVCDRGVVLREGRVVHDGDIAGAVDVFSPPSGEVDRARRERARAEARRDRAAAGAGGETAAAARGDTAAEARGDTVAAEPARPGRVAGERPVYYLTGITGYPNYGDELIAAAWLRHLATAAPGAQVWLDCPHPGQAAASLANLHPSVRFTDTLWRLCEDAPSGDAAEVAAFVRAAVEDPGRAPRRMAGIEIAARADVAHLIGGGYLNGLWPRNAGLLAGVGAAAERSGGWAVATGQGLSPAFADAALVRELVAGFALLDVRDEESAGLLGAGSPVSCTGDDLLLDLGPHLHRSGGDAPEVMVCAQRDLLEMPPSALADFVVRTLADWGVPPGRVGFAEGIPGADREIFGRVEARLPGARFFTFAEIVEHGLPVAPGQCWLTTRFHPHLVASAAGASGAAVAIDHGYYAAKHRSLIERGSRWTLVTDLEVPPRPDAGGFDPAVLKADQQAKRSLAAKIYP